MSLSQKDFNCQLYLCCIFENKMVQQGDIQGKNRNDKKCKKKKKKKKKYEKQIQ